MSRLLPYLLLLAVAVVSPWTSALPAELQVPNFWEAKERLPKPDLSRLKTLRFLTTTDFPPFNFLDARGKLSGFHVDLARAICAELSIAAKCQIQALPWSDLEPALARGDGEAILAGVAVTPDSRERFSFSRPYMRFPGRFITTKRATFTEPAAEALAGKRVGVLAGTAHEQMLRDYFGNAAVVPYARPELLFDDLKDAKIDAAFGDGMRLAFWLAGTDAANCCRFAGGPYLAPEYLGAGLSIATKPEDADLTAAFDAALQQISVKGIFAELYLRYFPVSFY